MERFENKVESDIRRDRAIEVANVEGQQGWELASVLQSVKSVHEVHLYFRRRLGPQQPTPEQVRTVRERTMTSMQLARAALVAADCDVEHAVQYVTRAGYA